jgi:hypothetical protein
MIDLILLQLLLPVQLLNSCLLIAFVTFNNIYKLVFCMLVFRYSAILIISTLYVAPISNTPLPPPFLFTYSLSTSAFCDAFYTMLVPS